MLLLALILFILTALLGVYLLTFVLQDKETPKLIAFTHGPLGALGLIILIVYAIYNRPAPFVSIVIFALTAMGGAYLIYRDLTTRRVPKTVALIHGLAAVTGIVTLLFFLFS